MPTSSTTPEVPAELKAAAEDKAREMGGDEFYVTWNDVRYGPFIVTY